MHTPFPIFTIFLIFVVTTFLYRRNLDNKRAKRDADFWEREEKAKTAPKRDLSEVTFICLPLDTFSLHLLQTDESEILEQELLSLADQPILNLNDMTNTDIRLAYGADNFDYMLSVGERFDRLETVLCDYAKCLMESGHDAEAIPVLEFGVEQHATISAIYTLLGECYHNVDENDERLLSLIETVESRTFTMRDVILSELRQLAA